MPRGFLVKRLQKHSPPSAYRIRRFSDEDRSGDSSSDHDDLSDKSSIGGHRDKSVDRIRELCRVNVNPDPDLIGSETTTALLLAAAYRRHSSDLKLLYSAATTTIPNDCCSKSPSEVPLALTTTTPSGLHRSSVLPTNLSLDRLTVSPASRVQSQHTPNSTSSQQTFVARQKRLATGELTNEYGGRIKSPKKSKAVRRLHFDEDKSSPVSGTIIRELDSDEEPLVIRKGDIDPSFNVVEITDEAKAEIAKIDNKIGDYVCQLCKEVYDDAFGLAQHRCSRIVHVEYRCPECDKVFNCPANLASHRRWHKPRPTHPLTTSTSMTMTTTTTTKSSVTNDVLTVSTTTNLDDVTGTPSPSDASSSGGDGPTYECDQCGKRFRRQSYLRRHIIAIHSPPPSNIDATNHVMYDTSAPSMETNHQHPRQQGVLQQLLRNPLHQRTSGYIDTNGNKRLLSPHLEKYYSTKNGNCSPRDEDSPLCSPNRNRMRMDNVHQSNHHQQQQLARHYHKGQTQTAQSASGLLLQMVHTVEATQ